MFVSNVSPDNTKSIVHRPLGLLDDHLGAAPEEDGDRFAVGALLDHQHLLLGRAEVELPDQTSGAELVC